MSAQFLLPAYIHVARDIFSRVANISNKGILNTARFQCFVSKQCNFTFHTYPYLLIQVTYIHTCRM